MYTKGSTQIAFQTATKSHKFLLSLFSSTFVQKSAKNLQLVSVTIHSYFSCKRKKTKYIPCAFLTERIYTLVSVFFAVHAYNARRRGEKYLKHLWNSRSLLFLSLCIVC